MDDAVAPRVGAWIETNGGQSHLKGFTVAPRVGAWIETRTSWASLRAWPRRAPCGRVD